MNWFKNITNLENNIDKYDAFIVDLWGVVHNGKEPYEGVIDAMKNIKSLGKKIILLSNAPKRANSILKHLEKIGIKKELYDGLLTSGEVTYHEIKNRKGDFYKDLGKRFFLIGREVHESAFENMGCEIVDNPDNADFLLLTAVSGPDDEVENYNNLFRRALALDLPMICANPDKKVMRGDKVGICSGALAEKYQEMGGNVVWVGKPDSLVYDYCIEGLGDIDKSKIAVIGNSFDTDVRGARNSGLDMILVSTGLHKDELEANAGELTNEDLIANLITRYKMIPEIVISGFRW